MEVNAPMHVDTDKIAENSSLQVWARLSMLFTPVLISVLTFFAWQWFEGQAKAAAQLRVEVNALSEEMPLAKQRLAVVENNMERGRKDREEFQTQTSRQLDQIQQALRLIGEGQAAMNATINAQQRQIDQMFNERIREGR